MNKTLLLSLFLFLTFPRTVLAVPIPGDINEGTDSACGVIHDLKKPAPETCNTKTNLEGEREEQIILNPDGSQTIIPSPIVKFDPLDTAKGNPLDIPTGKNDLELWLGRTNDGTEITRDMSCDEIIEKVISTSSPGDMHTGVWLRLRTPDDYVPDSLNALCEEIKQWYTEKSVADVDVYYQRLDPNTGTVLECARRTARLALPTWGPMQVANRIWRWLRPPNYTEYEEFVDKERLSYVRENALPLACKDAAPKDALFVANDNPAPPTGNPQAPSSNPSYLKPSRCKDGNCATVKDKDDKICFLGENQPDPLLRTVDIGSVALQSENYPVDFITRDPALGGGELYTEEETGEKVFDLPSTANYLFFPFLAGPQELLNGLWNTKRFAPGEGEDWKYTNLEEKGAKWFGLAHTVAEQAANCRATTPPEILAANPEVCGEVIDVLEGAATNLKRPGIDYEIEPEPTTPYTPAFNNPECQTCTVKQDSGISPKLLQVLNEAGSAFNVPANILLGIMRLESGHRGARPDGKAVWQYSEAELNEAISGQDPYCVRNEWCATGPFQFLTDPKEHQDKIYKQFGNSCNKWPGNTRGGSWDIWGNHTDNADFQSILGHSNPNPCNLRDAAFAAAAHVRAKVEYRNPSIDETSTCNDWDAQAAQDAWYTYHGNCSLGYCTTAANFLSNVCEQK